MTHARDMGLLGRSVMETALWLLGLLVYVVAVISFAAGVTWLVVRLFPTKEKKKADATAS